MIKNWMRADGGGERLKSSRDENKRHYRGGEGGGGKRPPLCDPGSELRLGREKGREKSGKKIDGIGKIYIYISQIAGWTKACVGLHWSRRHSMPYNTKSVCCPH